MKRLTHSDYLALSDLVKLVEDGLIDYTLPEDIKERVENHLRVLGFATIARQIDPHDLASNMDTGSCYRCFQEDFIESDSSKPCDCGGEIKSHCLILGVI